jgi:hypothetical protein
VPENGTLLTCRFDPEELDEHTEDTDFYQSGLNPDCYEPYDRRVYIETLEDWGWYGAAPPPSWFKGQRCASLRTP